MGFFREVFSSSANTIFIHTEKSQYFSGEKVTGTVTLCVVEATHIDGVYLKIKGFQEVSFLETVTRTRYDKDGKPETYSTTETRYQKDVFFRRRFCLHSLKCTLANANFVFPFEFVLDQHLPGSFSFKNGSTSGAITFKVKAEVAVPGFFKPNIKHSQMLLVREPLRQTISSTQTFKEQNVTFCCCIAKGQVSMSATIDKNAYAAGEQVNLHLVVDNTRSQVDLEHASFILKQSLEINAQGSSYSSASTLVKSKTPSIPRGTSCDRFIPLNLPSVCEPSCRSSLIRCEYILEVVLSVPWSPNVRIEQPVVIYVPQLPAYEANLSYPANFNAKVFETTFLQKEKGVNY